MFALDPQLEAIRAVDVSTGKEQFQLPAAGCNSHYNCGEVMVSGNSLFVSTDSRLAKYSLRCTFDSLLPRDWAFNIILGN